MKYLIFYPKCSELERYNSLEEARDGAEFLFNEGIVSIFETTILKITKEYELNLVCKEKQ